MIKSYNAIRRKPPKQDGSLMCTPLSKRFVCIVVAATLTGCGGDGLTLPGDGAPIPPIPPPVDGAPAALAVHAGDDQEGTAGKRLDDPLVVQVTDAGSRPVAGVTIVFRFQNDIPGAEVDPSEAETNDEGLASAEVRLGETAGAQPVEAQVASASSLRATFELTAVAKEKGGKGGKPHDDDDDDDDDDD
jgi:hypothetical protein